MTLDPATARPRPDLSFLTVRSSRSAAPTPVIATPAAPIAPAAPAPSLDLGSPSLDLGAPSLDLSAPAAPATPPAAPSLDLGAPSLDLSGGLDLSAPAAPTTPPAPTAPATPASLDLGGGLDLGSGLDLSAPTPPSPAPAPAPPAAPQSHSFGDGLLNLEAPATPPTAPAAASSAPSGASFGLDLSDPASEAPRVVTEALSWSRAEDAVRELGPRFDASKRVVLTPSAPTLALRRVESGIGTLTVSAAISGDVQLGCAYALTTGETSFFNPDSGQRTVPPTSSTPVLVGSRAQFSQIAVDLRQIHQIQRLAFIVHAASSQTWGGTLIFTTHSGARAEVPLDQADGDHALVAVSIYQVEGELVLRAELDSAASIREACQAFGYDAITWLDDRTPIS